MACRYQRYLDGVLESTEEFHEVGDLMARHATLAATQADLRRQQAAASDAAERGRCAQQQIASTWRILIGRRLLTYACGYLRGQGCFHHVLRLGSRADGLFHALVFPCVNHQPYTPNLILAHLSGARALANVPLRKKGIWS
jgi:hypothetical protein